MPIDSISVEISLSGLQTTTHLLTVTSHGGRQEVGVGVERKEGGRERDRERERERERESEHE